MVNYIRYRCVAKEDVKTKKLYVPELQLEMIKYKNGFRQNKKTEQRLSVDGINGNQGCS